MIRSLASTLILCAAAFADDAHPVLAIGAKAPDFSLHGIDGKTRLEPQLTVCFR